MKYLDKSSIPCRRWVVPNCPVEIIERLKYLAAKEHATTDLVTARALLIGLTELEAGRVADLPVRER